MGVLQLWKQCWGGSGTSMMGTVCCRHCTCCALNNGSCACLKQLGGMCPQACLVPSLVPACKQASLGRDLGPAAQRWGPRPIDLDIVFYESQVNSGIAAYAAVHPVAAGTAAQLADHGAHSPAARAPCREPLHYESLTLSHTLPDRL